MQKSKYRILFLLPLVLTSTYLFVDYTSSKPTNDIIQQSQLSYSERIPIVEPANNTTVITTQGQRGAPRFSGQIIALDPSGRLLYYNNSLGRYMDVDPIPNTTSSVVYVGTKRTNTVCGGEKNSRCRHQIIERVNLSTGETTRILDWIGSNSGGWHDVDRIAKDRYLVGDIINDRVMIVNASTDRITWQWGARSKFEPLKTGGDWPYSWTHINDVEYLDNGFIMVSIRNLDQIVFIDPSHGIVENMTLGAEDKTNILHAQHNPDFIPARRGGPAVVVSDSHNNRIVEYELTNRTWSRSWVWAGAELQWPRDGDRLPNGNTLITDTNGGRILEVNRQGEIIWKVEISGPYEAERLETGDESLHGPSAAKANLTSINPTTNIQTRDNGSTNIFLYFWIEIKKIIPSFLLNSILFIRPRWMSNFDLTIFAFTLFNFSIWSIIELRWSSFTFQFPITRKNN